MEDAEPILNLPRFRKAKTAIWKYIGSAETDKLLRIADCETIKSCLQESLQIADDPHGLHLILIDTYYYAVLFCKKNSFNSEKTSCFLSIIKQTHELASESPFGNLCECLKYFKELVLCHSVHRPPFCIGIFSPQEASAISYYFIDTYLRHFKLYKYAFTPQVQLDLSIDYIKIPKTTQELDDEKRSLHEELTTSARSEGEGLVELDKTEGQQGDQTGDAADAAAFDPKSASLKELKRLVRDRLTAEVQELKASFGSQVKQSDDVLGRLVAPAAAPAPAEADGKKSGSQSAKRNPKK